MPRCQTAYSYLPTSLVLSALRSRRQTSTHPRKNLWHPDYKVSRQLSSEGIISLKIVCKTSKGLFRFFWPSTSVGEILLGFKVASSEAVPITQFHSRPFQHNMLACKKQTPSLNFPMLLLTQARKFLAW